MAVSCMRHASGHNYTNSSFIVDVAMGQIPRSTERISSIYHFFNATRNTQRRWQCLISSISISAEKTLHDGFLASLYAIARLSSVTFVHPTQTIEIFGNVSTPFNTVDIRVKFYGDRPRGTPPSGELNTRGVAEYSDFRPIKRYISETVHDLS